LHFFKKDVERSSIVKGGEFSDQLNNKAIKCSRNIFKYEDC